MFLATTGLTEFWDTSKELLLLGPWCLRYDRKAEWHDLQYEMAPSPWGNSQAVWEAEQYCSKVIDWLVVEIAHRLNHIHGVNRSERYWRILLGPWLLNYVHALYERYVSLKSVLDLPGLETAILSQAGYQTPVDTHDFCMLANNECSDLFNFQLYSQVFDAIAFSSEKCRVVVPSSPKAYYKRDTVSRAGVGEESSIDGGAGMKKVVISAMSLLGRLLMPQILFGSLGFARGDRLRLIGAMIFRGRAWPVPHNLTPQLVNCDEVLRKEFCAIEAKNEFVSVLLRTLPQSFPSIYLEGYQKYRTACLEVWPRRPLLMVTASDWYFHETFKFLAAEFCEHGTRLVGSQHGGGYGISRVIPHETHECRIVDRWFSFGWTDVVRKETIRPLPHPMFRPLGNHHGKWSEKKHILLVATSHPLYAYRFESQPVGRFNEVLDWRGRFIRSLKVDLRMQLLVRLKKLDLDWYQAQRLIDGCGAVNFDSEEGQLRDRLEQARVVVNEYPGTSYLETLATNVPTVLFWDWLSWEARSDAEPYLDLLRQVGILWDSPEAAAAHLAEIYDDPWAWWGSQAVQEARRVFVDRYAYWREDWMDCWVKALEEEMVLSQGKE